MSDDKPVQSHQSTLIALNVTASYGSIDVTSAPKSCAALLLGGGIIVLSVLGKKEAQKRPT